MSSFNKAQVRIEDKSNSAISEAEISMVKCEIQSVFDKCNLI